MTSLYADENVPFEVVERLRELGYDVLTALEADQAGKAIADDEVLAFAVSQDRTVLTLNRWDFVAIHRDNSDHSGIVVCSVDADARTSRTHPRCDRIHRRPLGKTAAHQSTSEGSRRGRVTTSRYGSRLMSAADLL